jgi:hypothetical protein
LVLAGSGAYSLDNMLLKRNPGLADRVSFRWLARRSRHRLLAGQDAAL